MIRIFTFIFSILFFVSSVCFSQSEQVGAVLDNAVTESQTTIDSDEFIVKILKPRNNITVYPGEKIQVAVDVVNTSGLTPESVVVVTPNDLLQDISLTHSYTLIVPKDQTKSMTLVVVAEWKLEGGEVYTASDTIELKVDPSAVVIGDGNIAQVKSFNNNLTTCPACDSIK